MAFKFTVKQHITTVRKWFLILFSPLWVPFWVFIEGLKVIKLAAKAILIKRWAKEIHQDLNRRYPASSTSIKNNDCKNAAGLGGQDFHPAFVSWSRLYDQCRDPELKRWGHNIDVIKHYFFFAYFGPLEAWCDKNCQGRYYLWSNEQGIYRQFTDPVDSVFWKLTWNRSMPDLEEIENITH